MTDDAGRYVLADEAIDDKTQWPLRAMQRQSAIDRGQPIAVEDKSIPDEPDLRIPPGVEELVRAQDAVEASIARVDRIGIHGHYNETRLCAGIELHGGDDLAEAAVYIRNIEVTDGKVHRHVIGVDGPVRGKARARGGEEPKHRQLEESEHDKAAVERDFWCQQRRHARHSVGCNLAAVVTASLPDQSRTRRPPSPVRRHGFLRQPAERRRYSTSSFLPLGRPSQRLQRRS